MKEEEGRRGRRKVGEQPALTIKIVPALLANKHQFGHLVKMLQTVSNGILHKADAVKPQIPKPRPKLSMPRPGGQGIPMAFAFNTKVTFHNMPRNKRIKGYFAML